jgi:hypothetical protein
VYLAFAIRFILHLRYRHILLYRRYPKIEGKLKTIAGVKLTKPYRSYKYLQEYDCNKEAVRPLKRVFYAGSMGNGGEVDSDNDLSRFKFTALSPGTIGYGMLQAACKLPLPK